jgi:hypothetical protein
MIQMALNDVDAAFDSLERGCAGHDIGSIWLPVDPIWDPIRADERFARLVAAMGLEPLRVAGTDRPSRFK